MDAESAAGGRPGSGLLPGCSPAAPARTAAIAAEMRGMRRVHSRVISRPSPFHQRGRNPLSVPSPATKPFVIPSHCGSQPRSRSPLCRARAAGRVAEMPARPSAHPPRPGWRRVPRRERKWPSRILSLIEREAGAHPNSDMKILSGALESESGSVLKNETKKQKHTHT